MTLVRARRTSQHYTWDGLDRGKNRRHVPFPPAEFDLPEEHRSHEGQCAPGSQGLFGGHSDFFAGALRLATTGLRRLDEARDSKELVERRLRVDWREGWCAISSSKSSSDAAEEEEEEEE